MWDFASDDGLDGLALPALSTDIPGPVSREHIDRLAQHECPAVTARRARRAAALGAAHDDPIVWDRAAGANVVDVDGNRFVDLTAGFAVALFGHRHPAVVRAVTQQGRRLLHAMGDAWPDATRIEMLDRLVELCPDGLDVAMLGLSGSDAIDATLKTAVLATGRTGVLTFEGSYHGLALGVLGLQGYSSKFTEPFAAVTHPDVRRVPWGCSADVLRDALSDGQIGLVLAEPIQGRGGMRTAPEGWLAEVAHIARESGALFALDEIQSGLGRTGKMWGGDHEGVVPDLLCMGKALGGGFPISACVGTREVMNAWGASRGEAIHTQTFLGHPPGCAAALAVLDLFAQHDVPALVTDRSTAFRSALADAGFETWGRGLMIGVDVGSDPLAVARDLLRRGFLCLPAGNPPKGLGLTPPLCLSDAQFGAFVDALQRSVVAVRR